MKKDACIHENSGSHVDIRGQYRFMNHVFLWLSVGVIISALTSYSLSLSTYFENYFTNHSYFIYGLIILGLLGIQLSCIFFFRLLAKSIYSAGIHIILFLAYSILTGISFSSLLFLCTQQSITLAFIATSGGFLGLSLFGYITKRNLGALGTFCYMGLVGLIIVYCLASSFPSLNSEMNHLVVSSLGVIFFAGLTAYDIQKVKDYYHKNYNTLGEKELIIEGALDLYMDFIGMFINFLSIFEASRN